MDKTYLQSSLELKQYTEDGYKELIINEMADHAVYIDCRNRLLYTTGRIAERLNLSSYSTTTIWSLYKLARLLLHADDTEKMDKAMNDVLLGITRKKKLVVRVNIGDTFVWLQCHIAAAVEDDAVVAFSFKGIELDEAMDEIGIHTTRMENALKKSDLLGPLVSDSATEYVFKINLQENTGFFSNELSRLLGLPSYVIDKPISALLDYVAADDRDIVQRALMEYATGNIDEIDIDFRLRTVNYGYINVDMRGSGTHDANGEPILLTGIIKDLSQISAIEKDAEELSAWDYMTGLPNRYKLNEDLESILAIDGDNAKGALLLMDIDDFKKFNDMFGHSFGDKLILSVSRRLTGILPAEAQLYRFSGDEFIILWADIDGQVLKQKLELLLNEIRRAWRLGQDELYSTISMGIALYPQDGDTSDALLKNADIALNAAKGRGKNRAVYFSNRDEEQGIRNYHIETQLMHSLKNNYKGFAVYYQPIVDGRTGQWIAAEALLRWRSDQLGEISPIEVIPQLERMGVMVDTGHWILQQALAECKRWRKATGRDMYVDVNLSAIQVEEGSLEKSVVTALDECGLPPEALALEITETTLMHNMEHAVAVCASLRSKGVSVAIDDFGTGYSSLNYLRNLPVNILKVDRSFVHNLEKDKYNKQFISSIKDLAHVIQLSHCVEGVETHSQFEMLKGMKVDKLQGYYFGKPMPADVFIKVLMEKESEGNKRLALV